MSGETSVSVDPLSRVLIVGESRSLERIVDALSSELDSVSVVRERTLEAALDRLQTVEIHCAVCSFESQGDRVALERLCSREESTPIVAVTDRGQADRALDAGASDVVEPDESPSAVAARIESAAERGRYRFAAAASTARHRAILDASAAPMWVLDEDGQPNYANAATETVLGVTPDELERRGPLRFVHPDDRDSLEESLESVSHGPFGTESTASVRLRRAEGGWQLADIRAANRLADPQIGGVVVTVLSALPTAGAADALDRLDAALFALGPRWELQYANRAAAGLFDGEARPGTIVWSLLPADVRDTVAERLREARGAETPVSFEMSDRDSGRPLRVDAVPSETGVTVLARDSETADGRTDSDRLVLLEGVVDALDAGIAVLEGSTIRLANAALFELLGAERVVDRALDEVFDSALAAAIRERASSPIVEPMDPLTGTLVLGEDRPVDVLVSGLPGGSRSLCLVRDRRRSPASHLSTLEAGIRRIRDADSSGTVHRAVVESIADLTAAEFVAHYRVSESALEATAIAGRTASSPALTTVDRALVPVTEIREAEGASRYDRDRIRSFSARSSPAAARMLALPVGDGIVLATSTDPLAFGRPSTPVKTITAVAEVAIERVEHATRERECRQERATLEGVLDRTHRLRSLERDLLAASTRRDVERLLCRGLTSRKFGAEEGIELAWIGAVERGGERITPRERAGDDTSYMDEVVVRRDRTAGEPTGRAAATLEPFTVESITAFPGETGERWREHALERGFHAVLSVPLVADGFCYGVLSVYATRPGGFDERSQQAIEHLGRIGAFVIDSLEARRVLSAASATELELVVRDDAGPLSSIARRLGRPIEIQSIVPRSSGGSVAFVAVGADEGNIVDAIAAVEGVGSANLIGERGDDRLVQLVLDEPCLAAVTARHGGFVRSLTPTDGRLRAVVDLSNTVEVRSFVELLERRYPGTDLVARRERDRPPAEVFAFETTLRETLSDQQRHTLEVAYYGGFFEWPRERTGQELADSLGVSQPTFSRHIRVAQGKLCALLFETFDASEE
jgi:HTH-type transcriptional regulator, bacterioopsin transcriptional activator and related proteins